MAAAAVTSRIRLTTGVLLAPLHTNTALLAKGYAAAFEARGCDELIFVPATASPDQIGLLAEAVA